MNNKTDAKYLKQELYELIKKDESIFDFIQSFALDGLWYWDIEKAENAWVDPKLKTVLGYKGDESSDGIVVWRNIISNDDLMSIQENTAKNNVDLNNPLKQGIKFMHKSGTLVQMNCLCFPVKSGNGKILRILGVNHYTTEQEKAEIELDRLFDLVPDMIVVASTDGYFKRLNKEWEKVLGYSLEELKSKPFIEFIHPDDVEPTFKEVEKQLSNQSTANFINRYRCKNGEYKWLDWVAIPSPDGTNLYAAARDITEKKQIENKLIKAKELTEESEEKFRLSFENSNIGSSLVDLEGNIIRVNKKMSSILGYTKDELETLNVNDLTHPEDLDVAPKVIEKVLSGDINFSVYEKRFIHKNGNVLLCTVNVTIVKNSAGEPLYFISHLIDNTERERAKKELIKAKEKAEESDRFKTEFLRNMSHEIRTPLNAIVGFSNMLGKPNLTSDKRNSFVSIIQNNSKQLLSIVDDILTISSLVTKQAKIQIQKVDINSVIIELLAVFKTQSTNQNVSLFAHQQLSNKQAQVYTDLTKVTQILSNLISNALKFTHEGTVEFGYQLVNNELEFYVKDTGIGIEEKMYEAIFERFKQANASINRNYGGTGVGLSICKGFVELLGGKIWVKSKPSKGSTFYFTIPYKPVYKVNEPNKDAEGVKPQITILVAEDEESNYLLIEELLLELSFRLLHAKDGKEAVNMCKSNTEIALVIMDVKMPVMEGHEAAKIIKQERPSIPIIGQSAYALEYEKAKYEEIFDDYLTKPIEWDLLIQKVMKYVGKKERSS